MAGQIGLGWVADRAGHRLVLVIAAGTATAMNAVALAAGSLGIFALVFALNGFFTAAIQVSALPVLLEFAPTPRQNPTYVGIERTFLAPFGFALPLAGGLLIEASGYPLVFWVSAGFSVASAGVLGLLVRDPRRRSEVGRVRDSPPTPPMDRVSEGVRDSAPEPPMDRPSRTLAD
jgi:DHA2 family methylenomycin A resistance protein-like MFS transporter